MDKLQTKDVPSARSARGFSVVECIIALVILMIGSLGIVSVMNFSLRSTADARKRYGALILAQQRSEDVRNTFFADLAAGTTTEPNVVYDGVPYTITRTVVDTDINTNSTAPGPELKVVTITVRTANNPIVADTVTAVLHRMTQRPGPNRLPNNL